MTKLVILGAGGHGAVVADAAMSNRRWSEIVFLDDTVERNFDVLGLPVIDRIASWTKLINKGSEFFVGIGDNTKRLELLDAIAGDEGAIASIVHPSATISSFGTVGPGVVVCAGAVINPRTIVKRGSIVNTGATVDHDCVLGNAVHVSPGAHLAGGVSVGDRTWLGIGATVMGGISIGENVVVGAGAVVISDVPPNSTVVGVPARPIGRSGS